MQRLFAFIDTNFIMYPDQRAEKRIILANIYEGMAELLTKEEIKAAYDSLLNIPGYMEILRNSLTRFQREQVLLYASEVRREAIIRIERENSVFHTIMPYDFPPCPLSTDLFILPNGIKLDAFNYKDQLKYWRMTSEKVIKILEDGMKPVHGTEKSPLTFKTHYITMQLNTIRERLIFAGMIESITEDQFIYLFTERPLTDGIVRLEWKQSLSLCHEFLERVVYKGGKFDFRQINTCIAFPGGRKLDSNNKSTAQYKNDDILNPILIF